MFWSVSIASPCVPLLNCIDQLHSLESRSAGLLPDASPRVLGPCTGFLFSRAEVRHSTGSRPHTANRCHLAVEPLSTRCALAGSGYRVCSLSPRRGGLP